MVSRDILYRGASIFFAGLGLTLGFVCLLGKFSGSTDYPVVLFEGLYTDVSRVNVRERLGLRVRQLVEAAFSPPGVADTMLNNTDVYNGVKQVPLAAGLPVDPKFVDAKWATKDETPSLFGDLNRTAQIQVFVGWMNLPAGTFQGPLDGLKAAKVKFEMSVGNETLIEQVERSQIEEKWTKDLNIKFNDANAWTRCAVAFAVMTIISTLISFTHLTSSTRVKNYVTPIMFVIAFFSSMFYLVFLNEISKTRKDITLTLGQKYEAATYGPAVYAGIFGCINAVLAIPSSVLLVRSARGSKSSSDDDDDDGSVEMEKA